MRELQALVAPKTPQRVLVRGHAGRVINTLSLGKESLVEASKRAFRRWDARLTLAVWRAMAARTTGPSVRVVKNRGSRRNGAALSPEIGVFAPPSPFFKNV